MTDIELRLPDSSPLDSWQIGSSGPPAVCLCCGQKFDDDKHKIMGPYLEMPYIWVCKWCHDKPFLYFPDKKMADEYVKLLPVQVDLDKWLVDSLGGRWLPSKAKR